jgi:hypothetical protein
MVFGAAVGSGFAAATMNPQPEAMQSYSVGRQIGAAMLAGCDVALVKVSAVGEFKRDLAISPEMAAPTSRLELKVTEWLNNSSGTTNTTLTVSCVRRPELTKQSGGPWTVWEGIEPRVGQSLLIGLWTPDAPRPTWEGRPLEIAFVFAGADRIAAARSVLRLHSDFLRQPAGLLSRVSDPNEKLESAEIGYFVDYVFDRESRRDVDAAARLGIKLVRHRNVLPAARTDVIGKLEVEFYRLSQAVRAEGGQALSEIAANREDNSNTAALQVLARLVESSQCQLKLDDDRRRSLQETYRAWLARGGSAYPRFASELSKAPHTDL